MSKLFTHNIIKIKFVREGYLPNYPYHMISDEEMCDAFLPYDYDPDDPYSGYEACMAAEFNYFRDTYPLPAPELEEEYKTLISEIAWHLNELKQSNEDDYMLPDWVYSYMFDATFGPTSDIRDLHDMFVMLGTDNLYDEFDLSCAKACYAESQHWLRKLQPSAKIHRPPTIFGEPHVIKSLRLKASDLTDSEIATYINNEQ